VQGERREEGEEGEENLILKGRRTSKASQIFNLWICEPPKFGMILMCAELGKWNFCVVRICLGPLVSKVENISYNYRRQKGEEEERLLKAPSIINIVVATRCRRHVILCWKQ
jgi:hypothetical protein